MEYNFNGYLDDIVQPTALLPREKRTREPPAFIVRPQLFSMGSMQGPIYRESFSTVVDHSIVNLNFGQQTLFFRISFNDVPSFCDDDDDDDNGPLQFPILQAICPIDDIESVQLVKYGKPGPLVGKLTVTLRRPPRFEADFRQMSDGRRGLGIRRATDLDWSPEAVNEYGSGAPGVTPRGFRVRTPMKLGLWLTYRFDFSCSNSGIERVVTSLSRLRALDRPGAEKINVNPEADAQNMPVTSTNMSTRDHPFVGTEADVQDIDALLAKDKYAFEARYLLVGLVSQGLVLPGEVADIIHRLWPLPKPTRTAALRALFRLQRRALVGSLAKDQIDRLSHMQPPRIPPARVAVRRVVVTPTRVLLFPEVIEWGNRVLRAWPKQMAAGRFLRVGFADEDEQLRTTKRTAEADDIDPNGGVFARIRNVLKYGVCVAGRHYVFLAAGESQLKDHSCWMVCEEGDFTADRVRQQMGDFSAEHVVAKYAARMGLCLSATCTVVELEADDVEFLPDVKHGAYTYTDGVGNCSQELATLCAKALNSDRTRPSAVQIRMGGIKGVLSVHPHLEKNQVCIRPSMEKFKSPLRGLGVMRVSGYAPAHLNRQAICVMEALGVNITALLRAYEHQIDRAKNIELDFQALDTSRHPARHLYRNAFIPVVKMVKAGFKDQLLLQNVLRCIKCQLLRDLKYKARVLVNDGAYLIGVADEYDVLEEGEIYCAITPNGPKSRRVITGQCTIFRSPCVHPGDARLVTAVDNPAFQNYPMTDVVVFSTKKAARNLPSMCWCSDSGCSPSGGDLDGDFYTVLYDKDLQITREHEPMDYTPVTPLPKPTVEIADICDFVVDYIKSDVLGVVSHFFAAVADHRGPDHEYCLDLAKLASDAVDFPKSGVPVNIPDQYVDAAASLH
ncbi:RNA dependent RNA polymerase-domain-containing protein [Mycena pura]|uniref:RNA-dependent RNA polymerase n=1 Tax=Mycena pura TaxID=153505 RepID=A0AAD6VNR8_9AGAR|nr:RNA dependent RNA polymerase-domain-containing protein [Mycena pura]